MLITVNTLLRCYGGLERAVVIIIAFVVRFQKKRNNGKVESSCCWMNLPARVRAETEVSGALCFALYHPLGGNKLEIYQVQNLFSATRRDSILPGLFSPFDDFFLFQCFFFHYFHFTNFLAGIDCT